MRRSSHGTVSPCPQANNLAGAPRRSEAATTFMRRLGSVEKPVQSAVRRGMSVDSTQQIHQSSVGAARKKNHRFMPLLPELSAAEMDFSIDMSRLTALPHPSASFSTEPEMGFQRGRACGELSYPHPQAR